jgi:glycosyltransferase involved in cell wall biosynthesis
METRTGPGNGELSCSQNLTSLERPAEVSAEPKLRRLNVLVLDEWFPHPLDSGKRIRTWNLLRRLSPRHNIALICYSEITSESLALAGAAGISLYAVDPLRDPAPLRLYVSLAGNLFSRYPYSVSKHFTQRYADTMDRLLNDVQFDLVHFEWTPYARFLEIARGLPSLIMAHNIESQIWQRRARHGSTFVHRSYFALQARKMKTFEQDVLRRADEVAAVTSLDAEQARQWGAQHVSVVENGVDLDEFRPPVEPVAPDEILCLGSLDWQPNLDAVDYLIDEILPHINARLPTAKLRIVGRRPPLELQNKVAAHAGIELIGEVPDVRPYFARGAVVVVPLRIGGGSRIKILESMAMGKAIVSTSVGAEGLAVTDGVHLLLADSPEDFARRTVELLQSPDLRATLGRNGRKLVEERYGWDCAAQVLESAWLRIAGAKALGADSPNTTGKGANVSR